MKRRLYLLPIFTAAVLVVGSFLAVAVEPVSQVIRITVFGRSLVDDADAAAARSTLGLGTMATQSATDYGALSGTNVWTSDTQWKLSDNGAGYGPILSTFRDSASPAANDLLGILWFHGRNSAGAQQEYGYLRGKVIDPSNVSPLGAVQLGSTIYTLTVSDAGGVSISNTGGTGHVLKQGSAAGLITSGTVDSANITDDAVTDVKLRNSSALSVIGRSANSTGDPADIAASNDGEVLRRSGTSIGFGTVATAGLANDAVTLAKLQNATARYNQLIRSSSGSGDFEEVTTSANWLSLMQSADYAAMRSNLGLGTIATQASSSVSISGGSITGITDLAVADGGTGASTAAAAVANLGLRKTLSGSADLYVRTGGSDSNDGSADNDGAAFATIQKALDTVATWDIRNNSVTIHVADGTYSPAAAMVVSAPWIGKGNVVVVGNTTTPANCILNCSGTCVTVSNGGKLDVKGFEFRSSAGSCLSAAYASYIGVTDLVRFGATSNAHISAATCATINMAANYAITGGATYHYYTTGGGQLVCAGRTVTVSNSLTFSTFSYADNCSTQIVFSNSYGSPTGMTGTRYNATGCAAIKSGGSAAYFPVPTDGSVANNGVYY